MGLKGEYFAMNYKFSAVSLAVLFCLSACQAEPNTTSKTQNSYDLAAGQIGEDGSPESEETIPASLSAEGNKLASGMNAFGIELYRNLAKEPGDMFFSPVSISTAFGLVHAGAAGTTATEMAQVMHVPDDLKDQDAAAQNVQASLSLNKERRSLSVSNALWVQKDLVLQAAYLEHMRKNYAAGLKPVDFVSNPKGTRDTINSWVSQQTHGRIRGLIRQDQITHETKMHLINTAYFKAGWINEFNPPATEQQSFFSSNSVVKKIPMMTQKAYFNHISGDGIQAIALGYVGRETQMVVILPDKKDGLPALENRLSSEWLNGWLNKLDNQDINEVILTLPKFRLEQRRDITQVLQAMGMRTAFTNNADFSEMRAEKDIKLENVIHQVFLDIDEKGTEAAAATDMGADAAAEETQPKIFRADHPFFFLIRDRRTGLILFMGRFTGM
jgi:serpin B